MLQNLRRYLLALALGAAPLVVLSVPAHAQWGYGQWGNGQNSTEQRAYQAGYNNGVNDANQHKAMNLNTGKWNGVNLQAYQRGYEAGYRSENRSAGGNYGGNYGYGRYGDRDRGYGDRDRDRGYRDQGGYYGYGQNNGTEQRAYQAGYNNGVNDRNRNKPMNLGTGKWNGVNLQAYQRGYEAGYRSSGRGGWYRR